MIARIMNVKVYSSIESKEEHTRAKVTLDFSQLHQVL